MKLSRLIINGTYGAHKKFAYQTDWGTKSPTSSWKKYCKQYLNDSYTITLETCHIDRIESWLI